MAQAKVTGTTMLIEVAGTADRLLIADIEIDCPGCGQHHVRFAGHHLRSIRNFLIDTVDAYPELCGDEAGTEVIKHAWSGTPPARPEDN